MPDSKEVPDSNQVASNDHVVDLNERLMEKAAKAAAEDMGQPESIWHPEYGWIVKSNKVTGGGKRLMRHLRELMALAKAMKASTDPKK